MQFLRKNCESIFIIRQHTHLTIRFVIIFLFCFVTKVFSQNDSLRVVVGADSIKKTSILKNLKDGIKIDTTQLKQKKHLFRQAFLLEPLQPQNKPGVAFVRSIVPGWGQATNRHYWKLPFVGMATVAGVYSIYLNKTKCDYYRQKLIDNPNATSIEVQRFQSFFEINPSGELRSVPIASVKTAAEGYRRWKEQSVVAFGLGWLLIGVESYVSAHLKSFDVTDDISFKIKPSFQPESFKSANVGMKIQLNF